MTYNQFKFDIAGAPLQDALNIAALAHKNAEGWEVDVNKETGVPRLTLFWAIDSNTKDSNTQKFMAPLPTNSDAVVAMIDAWLATADYGKEPDTDGSVDKGCKVYNEDWGHVNNNWRAFVAIEPYWRVFGK